MRVLLAPLFFRGRFCKHCARIFYRQNPGSWLGLYEFESLPPLGSFDSQEGFVPDFPALLMFDEFVLDAEAYERITNPGDRKWLSKWHELIMVLESEGALTVADVVAAGAARSHDRGWMLRQDLEQPQRWFPAMLYYEALAGRAEKLLGASSKDAQDLAWEFDPEDSRGVMGSDAQVHNLAVMLREGPHTESPSHAELYDMAMAELRNQLREVNSCLVACEELAVAPMMWAPYRRYLRMKISADAGLGGQQAGHEFFTIAFPAYAPTSVAEFSRARSAKAIMSLRSEILRASETGDVLDPAYPQSVLNEVLKIETGSARTRRIIAWISSIFGAIPVPGFGLAASAAGEAVASVMESRKRKPYRWFYLISDGHGVT